MLLIISILLRHYFIIDAFHFIIAYFHAIVSYFDISSSQAFFAISLSTVTASPLRCRHIY